MNKYYLPGLEEWDDFDRVASVLTKILGWVQQERYTGPDARVGEFVKGSLKLTLGYDDLHGMDLQCEEDASHLPVVAEEIFSALKAHPA